MNKILSINHIWSVICNNSIIDQTTNNFSLFNILEQIGIPKKVFDEFTNNPEFKGGVVAMKFEIVSLWSRDLSKDEFVCNQKLDLIDPQGEILDSTEALLEIPSQIRRIRFKFEIPGLKITTPGDYQFKLSVKDIKSKEWEEVTKLPLEVRITETK